MCTNQSASPSVAANLERWTIRLTLAATAASMALRSRASISGAGGAKMNTHAAPRNASARVFRCREIAENRCCQRGDRLALVAATDQRAAWCLLRLAAGRSLSQRYRLYPRSELRCLSWLEPPHLSGRLSTPRCSRTHGERGKAHRRPTGHGESVVVRHTESRATRRAPNSPRGGRASRSPLSGPPMPILLAGVVWSAPWASLT